MRKSPTSAWRRSISSTRISETPDQAYKLHGERAAAVDAAAEAFEAAGAFEAVALGSAAVGAAALAVAEAAALALLAAAAGAAAVAAAAGAGGAGAAACRGEVAPSSARLERLAITLTDARRHARVRPGRGSCLQRFPGDACVRRERAAEWVANLSRSASGSTRTARSPG
jgi:hypothetical protein